ncbi:hypothetical protein RA266_27580, partial [Pseudomonas syringae pv. tagetis]|uniref:hypothetical protein n=1 Tax=Pseudomonas syringae group genomosp. 7 TaxID=251699 RepID=UPI00376F5B66
GGWVFGVVGVVLFLWVGGRFLCGVDGGGACVFFFCGVVFLLLGLCGFWLFVLVVFCCVFWGLGVFWWGFGGGGFWGWGGVWSFVGVWWVWFVCGFCLWGLGFLGVCGFLGGGVWGGFCVFGLCGCCGGLCGVG